MNRFKKQLIENIKEEKEVLKIPFLNYGNLIVLVSLKTDEYALRSIIKEEAKLYERRLGRKPMSRYQKHCAYRYMSRREAKKEMIKDHARKFRNNIR